MRFTLLLVLFVAGCIESRKAAVDPTIAADLACEGARLAVLERNRPPSPAPDAGRCDNCNGTGKIGDGRITHTCPACKGTGKK